MTFLLLVQLSSLLSFQTMTSFQLRVVLFAEGYESRLLQWVVEEEVDFPLHDGDVVVLLSIIAEEQGIAS